MSAMSAHVEVVQALARFHGEVQETQAFSKPLAKAIEQLLQASEAIGNLREHGRAGLHPVVAAMHHLCASVEDAEAAGVDSATIQCCLTAAREEHAKSPFVRRLQTWPRGYQGDFETIEYLLRQRVHAPLDSVEYWLEYYALSSAIAQQHRNKVGEQANRLAMAASSDKSARVLVLACGSSPDVAAASDSLRRNGSTIVLNDADPEALSFSLARLPSLQSQLVLIPGNVLACARDLQAAGPFDLIVAGGLFDYLSDRQAHFLLKIVASRLLRPGGVFFFTNLSHDNPYRVWLHYCANWFLNERSDTQIVNLVHSAFGLPVHCATSRDATGLAIYATASWPER